MSDALVALVQASQGRAWAPPAYIAAYALACLGLPITPFALAGGVLFRFWPGALYALGAEVLGALLAFILARRWARPWALKAWGKKSVPKLLSRPNFTVLLVARLVGFPPFHLLNLLAGLSEMRAGPYAAATALGMLPWTLIMTFFSHFLWDALLEGGKTGLKRELFRQAGPLLLLVFLFGMLVGLSAFLGRKYLRQDGEGGN